MVATADQPGKVEQVKLEDAAAVVPHTTETAWQAADFQLKATTVAQDKAQLAQATAVAAVAELAQSVGLVQRRLAEQVAQELTSARLLAARRFIKARAVVARVIPVQAALVVLA